MKKSKISMAEKNRKVNYMQCRMCGYEFDETRIGGCAGCGNCADGKKAHCPNCGYGNPMVYEERDFEFIEKLKVKLGLKSESKA